MQKKIISIFFSILFVALISAPSIVVILNDSVDMAIIYSSPEEENGSEKTKESEIVFYSFNIRDLNFYSMMIERNTEYFFKNYSKPHTNIISPPPEYFVG